MKNTILFLFFLSLSIRLYSNTSDMIVEHYSAEDGLPNNMVKYSLKDKDGFMWFGTWYGLCRFDGLKFKTYNIQNNNSFYIPPRKIQKILEDNNGYLWINTIDRKLFVFNKYKETFHAVYDEIKAYTSNLQVIKIDKGNNGEILILTKDKNLLLATIDINDRVYIKKLVSSQNNINTSNFQLLNNILSETKDYLSWVGCDFKIVSFRKNFGTDKKISNEIISKMEIGKNEKLNCIYSNNNIVWIGSSIGSLFQINMNNGVVKRYNLPQLFNSPINNILVTSAKTLYLNTLNKGTYIFDLQNKNLKRINIKLNENIVNAYIDKYDKIWFYEKDKALIFYDPDNNYQKRFDFQENSIIGNLHIEDAGTNGIFFLTPSGDVLFFDRKNLCMRSINSLEQLKYEKQNQSFFHMQLDNDGILWLSSSTNGIYRISFPQKTFNVYVPKGLENLKEGEEGIRALYQTRNGDIWVGSRKKLLYRLDSNGEIKHIYSADQIGSVYNIMEDNRGNLWICTKRNGLFKGVINGNDNYIFTNFKHNPKDINSISGNDIYYSIQDHNNNIWIATLDGGLNLVYEKEGTTKFINKYNGFKNYPKYGLFMETRNIVEDKNNRIWVGTMDGLMSFNSDFKTPESVEFETYRDKEKTLFTDNDIYTLYRDRKYNIWIGAFGSGLSQLSGYNASLHQPEFKLYDSNNDLNNNVVKSFVEDDLNHLWLSTEKGISSFNLSTGHLRNYDKYDGFPQIELEDNTSIYTQDKELWLGCREGILIFSPYELENNKINYNTFIVNFKISNREISSYKDSLIIKKSIEYSDKIVLEYNQSMFSFEFSALNYYNQNRVSYRYILEGYEKEWHYNKRNRVASYSNVPPGEYIFKVQTFDSANPKLKSFKELKVVILPPWWATWWAYTIYALLSIGLIILVVRFCMLMIKVKNDIYIEQKISELKIKFFTNISHELRTPLTLIQGPIEELREKEKLSEKGTMYLELMNKNINQMLQLVNQLLDFRKIKNGKMKLHLSWNCINDIIKVVKNEFDLLAEENDITFSLELPSEDIELWVDKEKIITVLRNLLSNAFKFTPVNGVISIKLEKIDDLNCKISVYDNGPEIPKEDSKEIFERFSQSKNNKGIYSHGTGIGLALSKEIINLHHGQIYSDENVKNGATFIVVLSLDKNVFNPREVDYYIDDRKDEEQRVIINQEINDIEEIYNIDSILPTIQIVEDNKDLCNMLKLQLNNKFNVITANNGVEGLKLINMYNPDLIITDLMMPEMDGLKMLEKIRKDFQISHIPVIILTAKGDDESRTKAIALGANSFITKPFSKDYLMASIDQLLHERQILQERMRVVSNIETTSSSTSYEQYIEKRDLEFMQKIHQIINDNIDNIDFNIDTIAANIGLSRSSFFKKLKGLTGFAPVDLVKEVRLNKSIELINSTDMTISEIAFTVGFKDSGYFSKCFRKRYNKTPREYILESRKS